MKKKMKKLACILMTCICIMGMGIVSHAQTSFFTVKVTENGYNQDNISKRTVKDDGTYLWSVNTSYFSQSGGKIDMRSVNLNNTAMKSPYYTVSDMDMGEDLPLQYHLNVPNNQDYYMECKFNANCPGTELTVQGYYTP